MRYTSSQMTGKKDWNYPRFHLLAFLRRRQGIEIFNPAEEESYSGDWVATLSADLKTIQNNCDEIEMFGAWSHSAGAWLELITAVKLGKRIILPWNQRPIVWLMQWWFKPTEHKLVWWLWDLMWDIEMTLTGEQMTDPNYRKVTGYKTSDGKIFSTETEAQEQAKSILKEEAKQTHLVAINALLNDYVAEQGEGYTFFDLKPALVVQLIADYLAEEK